MRKTIEDRIRELENEKAALVFKQANADAFDQLSLVVGGADFVYRWLSALDSLSTSATTLGTGVYVPRKGKHLVANLNSLEAMRDTFPQIAEILPVIATDAK